MSVDLLDIEYRDGGQTDRETITLGEADWLEPTDRVHRAVNAGADLRNLVKKIVPLAIDATGDRPTRSMKSEP